MISGGKNNVFFPKCSANYKGAETKINVQKMNQEFIFSRFLWKC